MSARLDDRLGERLGQRLGQHMGEGLGKRSLSLGESLLEFVREVS